VRRRLKLVLVATALMVWCSTLLAQQRPEVFKVLGISVEGQRTSDPAAIIANTGLKIGDEISLPGDQTRTAIERLYGLRLFDDVQILVENRTPEGVYLLIRLRENPRLEKTEIVGNDELSEDEVMKRVNLVKGQIVTAQDLSLIVRMLRLKYSEDGYLNAEVKPVQIKDSTGNRVTLRLNITEGPKVKVDAIRFHGNKRFDDDDLKGPMKETSERAWWKFWASNKFDKKKYEEDKHLILAFYQKNGYRDAEILSDSISYDKNKQYMTIDIFVREGAQYRVRNIIWDGNTVYPVDALSQRLGFQKGDIYDKEKFEKNLYRSEEETDVSSLYMDNGYLMFQAEPEETPVGGDSLDVTIHMREHNQFRIGQVNITGNTKTYEKVIRRELFTLPGDYFSRQGVIRSARQLSQLNYFNPEKIKPDTRNLDAEKGLVDLEYAVEEKSSDTFNMSVGYSGYFGFNGALGLTFNNFSLKEPLRGGAGQQLSFDWQFGEGNRYRTFSIGFTEPWMLDTPTLVGINLFDQRQVFYYDLRLTGASVRVGRRFKWPDYLFRGDWTIRFQRNDVISGGSYYLEGLTTQVDISQVISRNSTDSPIFPTRGSNISLLTELSGGILPGNVKFSKHIFSADWYVPILGGNRIALAVSSTLGFVFGIGDNPRIQPTDVFFMGGTGLGYFNTTPLRGYEDRGVGPPSGGLSMLKHSAELRFALAINPIPIYTLLFAEAGNVWKEPRVTDPMDLRRSAGVGVRLLINPIGMVGFDYGYGFDAAAPGGSPPGWRFHFQFGKGF
jgi:outer membrane protein insertion porin family